MATTAAIMTAMAPTAVIPTTVIPTAMVTTAVISTAMVAAAAVMATTIVAAAAGKRFSRSTAQDSSGNNCRRENHFLQLTAPVIIGFQPLNKPLFTKGAGASVQ